MKKYLSGLLFLSMTSLFASDSMFVVFYDPIVKVTSSEKSGDIDFLYFDLDNIKDSKKVTSCMIESSNNELKNLFCVRTSDHQTLFTKIEGKNSEDGTIILNGSLFELNPLNLKL